MIEYLVDTNILSRHKRDLYAEDFNDNLHVEKLSHYLRYSHMPYAIHFPLYITPSTLRERFGLRTSDLIKVANSKNILWIFNAFKFACEGEAPKNFEEVDMNADKQEKRIKNFIIMANEYLIRNYGVDITTGNLDDDRRKILRKLNLSGDMKSRIKAAHYVLKDFEVNESCSISRSFYDIYFISFCFLLLSIMEIGGRDKYDKYPLKNDRVMKNFSKDVCLAVNTIITNNSCIMFTMDKLLSARTNMILEMTGSKSKSITVKQRN